MYTYHLYQWLTFFYLYCFFGWIFESAYVSLRQKRFVNRGFLRIPMLPLYGSGAVMMLWVSIPVQDNRFLTWLSGVIGATLLEYVTGYIMELLFKIRYWDYSDQKYNLHGYICLSSSIAWGFLTIFMTHLIHKPIERAVLTLPVMWDILFVSVTTVIFVYDLIVCTKEALAFGKSLEALQKIHGELDDIRLQATLLKAEAREHLKETRAELRDQLEARYGNVPTLAELHQKLHGKSEQQLAQLKSDTDTRLSALLATRHAFRKGRLRSNPSAASRRYTRELKTIREFFEHGVGGER